MVTHIYTQVVTHPLTSTHMAERLAGDETQMVVGVGRIESR